MKRIIGFLLIFSILVCSLSAGFIFSADYDTEEGNIYFSLSFDNTTVTEDDILNVTVNMKSTYESFSLSGIQFDIKYEYNGTSRAVIPVSFELIKEEMTYDKRFSKELQVGTKYDGNCVVTTFMSEPDEVFYEDELSITFPFLVKETLYEGEYTFVIDVGEMYYTDMDASSPDDMFPSLNYTVEGEDYLGWLGYPIWYGDESQFTLAGDNSDGTPIMIDKDENFLGVSEIFIKNTDMIALDTSKYDDGIEQWDDILLIYFKGVKMGHTAIYITSDYIEFKTDPGEDPDSTEDDVLIPYAYKKISAVKVEVTKPDIWFPSISKQPDNTVYYVGDEIDITGLEFTLGYNNNDTKIVSNGFKIGEYDFSTPGEKRVKINYTDEFINTTYCYLTVNVLGLISDDYEIDQKYVYNIPVKTSVEGFIAATDFGGKIEIYDGSDKLEQGTLKTGMKIKLSFEEKLLKEFTLVIRNDINGNGRVDIRDLVELKKIMADTEDIDELGLKIFGVNDSSELNAQSLINVQKEVLGVK